MKKITRRQRLLLILVALFAWALAMELVLRYKYGFCDAVLSQADKDLEYVAQPNQDRMRFGKHVFYNAFSQRSEPAESSDSVIIAGFGDSVINGGAQTDQDSLATSKLTRYLSQKAGKPVKVLNVSYGSWGPDNCFAYLQKYGNFGAQQFLLVVSSHDAYDNINFTPVIDIHPSYPSKQYPLAILELLNRYLWPRIIKKAPETAERMFVIDKRTAQSEFNPGFQNFLSYSRTHHIPLMVYLHADRDEKQAGKYNEQGLEIIRFCQQNNLPLIKELDYSMPVSAYRDVIHPNEAGQDFMFQILKDRML